MALLHLLSAAAAAAAGTAVVLAAPAAPGPAPSAPVPAAAAPGAAVAAPGAAVADAGPSRVLADPSRGPARAGPGAAASAGVHRWRWPVPAASPVLRPFRAPPSPWAAGHRGLDLGATAGVLVRAVESGVVTHAGRLAGRGTVTITHGDGLRSTYEPVSPLVAEGQTVSVGDPVGRLEAAAGHCGARACLHLGARQRAGYLDPWPLLAGGRVRLLPRPP
ncbi:murein hydrolase activator EnvC family protein [Phycicoccus duodecadis]|uniref:Peptidase M23-like protein n=1 Tax=Phycicoccus duodecadis TaxID=173053 RepID=A0A2N3YG74_9MICO|nr:M23 family metallopeptidase [Phycicoccus duodecadis]PKW25857.1 peptidase M23-like protein [Phycicoccus duodecadis]